MDSHIRQIALRQQTAATGRQQGFGTGPLQPTTGRTREDRTYDAIERLRTTQAAAFSSLAGKIKDDKESTVRALSQGFASTGKQIDDKIAPRINPKLTDLERRTAASGSLVAGAIAANRASINQSINIKVDVTASGIHKTVTIQNRYGRATGSAHTDRNGNLGFGGAR